MPRATLASLLVLVLAAGASFGFVLQRGSLDIPAAPTATPDATTAALPTATAAPTSAITPVPSPSATTGPTPQPTAAPTPTPAPTQAPTPAATPTRVPTTSPPAASDRYALLTPCPDAPDCWIYVVRAGDNLESIANFFGHPLATILVLNPGIVDPEAIRAGDEIRMPPPTR